MKKYIKLDVGLIAASMLFTACFDLEEEAYSEVAEKDLYLLR